MRAPSGLNAAENTPPGTPLRTAISLPVAVSQMRALDSGAEPADPDAVTMRFPSGLKVADQTSVKSYTRRTAISLSVAVSQMRAVPSSNAVTMRDPSGLYAAEDMVRSLS